MSHAYFLTGTDTEIGKTFITCALLHRAVAAGRTAAGLKPVAAGCDTNGLNDDVERIRAASSAALPLATINPYFFKAAIAPHLAAAEEGVEIRFATIEASIADARQAADFVVVEGVGGFRVPLGPDGDAADLAVSLGLPVILVVGMRLGCLNHALLTADAIIARGLRLAGWVANRIDPDMARFDENLASLQALLPATLLGVAKHEASSNPAKVAAGLALPD